ncbi:AraC family transcriptional regulator [Bifidobacterium sp. ESL0798]|uniref:AraC family transcriptional regulator n=1 Tax=Bifidobacterium sp. ESL0798 TaxID=2983235 RepID=UPI0023F83AA5|nr:AraC family transcriptional regulator [Bifidobacterium sp. ESL0798]WEV74318.1 AraC family transcriptional regulator [Bifidobacterium sp. ESL0798]
MEHSLFLGTKSKRDGASLAFSYCGISQTEAGHSYGPSLTDSWVFHIVLSGTGEVHTSSETYRLGADDGFLIHPNDITRYQASRDTPWAYLWFAMKGDAIPEYLDAMGFSHNTVAFSVDRSTPFLRVLSSALYHTSDNIADQLELNALANHFLSTLSRHLNSVDQNGFPNQLSEIVKRAISVIHNEWHPGITAGWVSRRINVDRSYLSRLFHKETNITLKNYIDRMRLSHARDLLGMTDLSVAEIAVECGFNSEEALTRSFRETQSMTPTEFRRSRNGVVNNLGIGINFLRAAFNADAGLKDD